MFSKTTSNYDKTGFVRKFELSHTYKDIDNDIEQLIREGYLIEIKNKSVLFGDKNEKLLAVNDKGSASDKNKEFETSILYPVNLDADPYIEVRGSVSKYE